MKKIFFERSSLCFRQIFSRGFFGFFCVFVFSAAFISCARVGQNGVVAFTLKNGIPVYYKSVDSTQMASVLICVRGGTVLQSREESGLESELFEIMSRGGERHSYDDLRLMSHDKHIFIGHTELYSGSYLSLSCLSSHFDQGLDALLDCFLNPAFDEEQFANMMTECEQALQRTQNDPESLLFYTMNKEIYKGHPLSASTSVLPESQKNITLKNLKNHYNKILDAKRIFVVAAGDVKLNKLRRSLSSSLGKISEREKEFNMPQIPPLEISGPKVSLKSPALSSSSGHIAIAFKAPAEDSLDLPAARVAALMYNESLFNVVRTKYGACYTPSVSCGFSPAPYGTVFLYRVSDMKNAASYVPKAQEDFLQSDIEGKLSGYIKKYLSSVWQNQMSCASIAGRSANALLAFGDIDGFDKIAAAAKKLTSADIRRIFKEWYLDGSKRVFEISGE